MEAASLGPGSSRVPTYLTLLLGVALGLLVLTAAAALVPAQALPQPVSDRRDRHRELLVNAMYASAALVAAVAVGLAVGLVVALS